MPTTLLGLFDLLSPYFVVGVDLGDAIGDALNFLEVVSLDSAYDETGVVLWGRAKFGGGNLTKISNFWDINDTEVTFRLTGTRIGSTDIQTAVDGIPAVQGFPGLNNFLQNLLNLARAFGPGANAAGAIPAAAAPTDYPNSTFRLEILFTAITFHLPNTQGATLDPTTGGLKADPANPDVRIILPKISFDITQGQQVIASLNFQLNSWGAQGLDDNADAAIGNLIEMQPQYALVGKDATFGFGFQRAVLDLSNNFTPPEILAKFGAGTDWQGIYLPEVRIFFAPRGLDGWQFAAATRDLMIGVGATSGISGDFELDVIHQAAPLAVQVRFYTPDGALVNGVNTEQEPSPLPHVVATSGMVVLPAQTTMVVDIHSGLPPYTLNITGGGGVTVSAVSGHALQRAIAVSGNGTLLVTVADSTPGSQATYTLSLTVNLRSAALPLPPVSRPTRVTGTPIPDTPGYAISLISQTDQTATLQVTPPDWVGSVSITTVSNGASSTSTGTVVNGKVTVPVAAAQQVGDGVTVEANWTMPAGARNLSAYFPYDDPDTGKEVAWSNKDDGTSTHECDASGCHAQQFLPSEELSRFIQDLPASGSTINIVGYASFEPNNPNRDYNLALSKRRGDTYKLILANKVAAKGKTATINVTANGNTDAEAASASTGYDRAHYWRADATYSIPGTTAHTGILLTRPAQPKPKPDNGVPAAPPDGTTPRPNWFRYVRAMVRIANDEFIAAELRGEVDFQTATENSLSPLTSNANLPPGTGAPNPTVVNAPGNTNAQGTPNAEDGVVDYSLQVTHDKAIGQWQTALTLAAGKNDTDGLVRWSGNNPDIWRDILGIMTTLSPLLNPLATAVGANGGIAALTIGTDVAVAIAAFSQDYHLVHVPAITLYGGELIVRARDTGDWDGTILVDVETMLAVNLTIGGVTLIQTNPATPIKVRYKAVGFRLNFGVDPTAPVLMPVFDSSRGYSLDISDPGTLQIPPPLNNLLQVLGTRIARTNPLNLELDVGMKADLGVVKVERVAMRIPLDPPGIPTLSGLGVGVDIPGALTGKGYLKFLDSGGFEGSIDLTITPIKLRVAAGIAIEPITDPATGQSATSVFFTIQVDFPAPIVLGASGLGLYGLAGLFGMHRKRDENPAAQIPALDWFDTKAQGDPTKLSAWKAAIGSWAFGVGAVLGTLEGAIVFNLKGMLMVELPGPRILIFMNAKMFTAKPDPKGVTSGGALAVIDLDFARGYIQIGIKLDLDVASLITLHVPVDIFFDTNVPANFRLDLGTFAAPASAMILGIYKASGYLMIHGNGIDPSWPGPGGPLTGFAIAVGFKISMLWGSESSGLYLKAWASMDVGVGFSPFRLGGTLSVGGALHLWVVSIEASARLDVTYPPIWVHGEVCGRVDCFFFEVKGCVGFTLGQSAPPPDAPKLFRGMILQSRSPALLMGTGSDRPIDGSLGTAQMDGSGNLLTDIPIDAIPVLQLEMPPDIAAGFTTNLGGSLGKPKTLPQSGWVKRGRMSYKYVINSITIAQSLTINPGEVVPLTWRTRHDAPGGDDNNCELALLDWTPNATPKALTRSEYLIEQIEDRWIRVCFTGAPPTSILWTFQEEALGASPKGWTLEGTAWPDPPDTIRSEPPDLVSKVNDKWRTGNELFEAQILIEPSIVVEPCRKTTSDAVAYNSRMLQGPYLKGPTLIPTQSDLEKKMQDLLVSQSGLKITDIEPMIRIDTGPLLSLTLLLLIPAANFKNQWVILRARDAKGNILAQVPITKTVITTWSQLPASWIDTKGPWAARLDPIFNCFLSQQKSFSSSIVLFKMDMPKETVQVELGMAYSAESRTPARPSFILGAMEGLKEGEALRADFDETQSTSDVNTLQDMLDADPASRVLLKPNTQYTVTVNYTATSRDDETGTTGSPKSISQNFSFKTDDEAPKRLDPWMLTMTPVQSEGFHFYEDPLRLIFSTDDVIQLWKAYGKSLKGVVRAASFVSDTLPISVLDPLPGSVLSPFEETLIEVLADPDQNKNCINWHVQKRHGQAVMAFKLEPVTDYTFDIETDPATNPPAGAKLKAPLFRRGFTTSQFPNLAAFVKTLKESYIGHRSVDSGAQTKLNTIVNDPTEAQMQAALLDLGLGSVPVPRRPQVTVLWETVSGVPKPRAILIDAPEPLWRTRQEPSKVVPDPSKPEEDYWTLQSNLWLRLVEQNGAYVSRMVHTPGGARALVMLKDTAKGKTVYLGLERLSHPLMDPTPTSTSSVWTLSLAKAPWED